MKLALLSTSLTVCCLINPSFYGSKVLAAEQNNNVKSSPTKTYPPVNPKWPPNMPASMKNYASSGRYYGMHPSYKMRMPPPRIYNPATFKSVNPSTVNSTVNRPIPLNPRFINRSKQMSSNFNTVRQAKPQTTSVIWKNGPPINKSKPITLTPANSVQGGEQVVLQSREISALGLQWQSFTDYLSVPKGCDQIPMFLTFNNGPSNGAKLKDLRVSLGGKTLVSLTDFNGQTTITRNLGGVLREGDNLLTVQAYGPAGAKFSWKFTTPKITVTKVNPNSFGLTDKIVVEGKNFSTRPNVTQVFIGDKPATIVSVKSNSCEIKAPVGLLGGKTNLYVMVGRQKSASIPVTIKGAPEILGVNMISTAPGQPITISGMGFSPVAAENVVTIGGYPAEITSASPTSIQCIVPMGLDPLSPVWDLPVKVKTNNMDSTDPTNSGKNQYSITGLLMAVELNELKKEIEAVEERLAKVSEFL